MKTRREANEECVRFSAHRAAAVLGRLIRVENLQDRLSLKPSEGRRPEQAFVGECEDASGGGD